MLCLLQTVTKSPLGLDRQAAGVIRFDHASNPSLMRIGGPWLIKKTGESLVSASNIN